MADFTIPPGEMTVPTPPPAPANQPSAHALIQDTLDSYGLGSLGEWAWQQYLNGSPAAQIMLELRQRPEYKARFPAMATLAAKGRAISETEYIAHERQTVEIMRAHGLPAGFYDTPEALSKFIANEISPVELQARVQDASALAVLNTPPETQAELGRLYGVGRGGLTAYFLDPTVAEPILHQRFVASQLGGRSVQTGYGQLSADALERLAARGVTEDQAQKVFSELTRERQLFQALPGEATPTVTGAEQLGAGFYGNTAAQTEIERIAAQRKAELEGGGEFARDKEGLVGLGAPKR